jgi:signal transduction histidine kinase
VRNGAALAVIAGSGLLNGFSLDYVPAWRQLLFVVLAIAAYLHGRHSPVRRSWLVWAAVAVPGLVYVVLDFWTGVGALVTLGVFVVLPWLAGAFRRQQAELVDAGRQRVAQLELEREFVNLRERERIAADMHDSLGHELALIALRAGALELAADMTEQNREAVAQLRASAVTATDRLRRTLGVLRRDTVAGESIEALVERARAAGMTVALRAEYETLPPLVDSAAHRVARESLTNAARHAPGAEVLVRVEESGGSVTVTVSNTASDAPPAPEGGSGIAGLRERVRLLGGTLSAGPDDGGFTVTAWFPSDRERAGGRR